MRHPVSTLLSRREGLCCFVRLWIVGLLVGPGAPEDPDPGAGQNTDGMGVIAAAAASPLVDVGGPGGGMARIVGEAGDGSPQAMIAGPAERHAPALARGPGDGADTGLGRKLILGLETLPHIAEFSQDLRGADPPGAWKGHDDLAVGQLGDGLFDAARQLDDLGHQAGQDGGEGTDKFATRLGFSISRMALRRRVQAGKQFGWGAAAT